MLGIDLQQVSVATLIIALGLLVDVPVVAGDGIKRGLAEGLPRGVAAWLGPTKLATAIFYCDADEHHCLSSFSHAQRQHRRISQEPPHRHDHGTALCFGGCHDVRATAGLLHSKSAGKERNLPWKRNGSGVFMVSITVGGSGNSTSLVRPGRVLRVLTDRRLRSFTT